MNATPEKAYLSTISVFPARRSLDISLLETKKKRKDSIIKVWKSKRGRRRRRRKKNIKQTPKYTSWYINLVLAASQWQNQKNSNQKPHTKIPAATIQHPTANITSTEAAMEREKKQYISRSDTKERLCYRRASNLQNKWKVTTTRTMQY